MLNQRPLPRFTAILIDQNHVLKTDPYSPVKPRLDLFNATIFPRRPKAIIDNYIIRAPDHLLASAAGKKMTNILLSAQKVTLSGIRIIDKYGTVVAGQNEVGMSLGHVYEVKRALTGRYTSILRERLSTHAPPPITSLSRGAGIRIFTAFPILDQGKVHGVVYLSRTPQNILKHLSEIKLQVFFLIFLLVAITSAIVLFLSSRLLRPITELISQTQQVTRGEISTVSELEQPGTYEFAQLSHSFSEMSRALQDRIEYIGQFAAHVSHEFKTPLTSMRATLEILEDHSETMSRQKQQHFLSNLQQDTERLNDLVYRLLEQARADTLQTSLEKSHLLATLSPLASHYQVQGLNIHYDDSVDYELNIAPAALESVLSNLLANSLQHNANTINISFKQESTILSMALHDNGSGISLANQSRIFTPFFTTRRDVGGTGLGLGIVRSTLQTWGHSIILSPSEQGALFIIQFRLNISSSSIINKSR